MRLLLIISLVIAIALAWGLGVALERGGSSRATATLLAIAAFAAVMVPWSSIVWWTIRRSSDLEELTERARAVAEERADPTVSGRTVQGGLGDLARAIEEVRATFVRQRSGWEQHRAAMDEIVAGLGEGLIAVSRERRVVVANRRVAEMFGSGQDVVGRTILEVVRKQTVAGALENALEGKACTDRVTYGSGSDERQIEVRAFPVEATPEIAAVALFIDVTTIERLQRIRREFLDDFSHEIRTPLAGLRSAAETLDHGGLTRENEQQLRHVIHRQIARIERLVKDLSELNQIESGQLVLQRRKVGLRQFLTELCGDLTGRPDGVHLSVTGEDISAFVDPPRAQQIFTNLLDNALKHGGPRGKVCVEVSSEDADAIVRVSDTGPGIPPAELERIFHRFYRVDRSRSQSGTGLGLAIAKHLAVAHGGSIRAFNRPEGGATFEVRLPLQ